MQVLFFFILLLDLLSDDMTASVDTDLPLHLDVLAIGMVDKLQCTIGPVDHKGMLAEMKTWMRLRLRRCC